MEASFPWESDGVKNAQEYPPLLIENEGSITILNISWHFMLP
jgi:hypothetical protein